MRYYELTINTREIPKEAVLFPKMTGPTGQVDALLERVVPYLPGPAVQQQKNPSFLSLEFYAEPEKIPELEKKLKTDSLRYLILAKKLSKKTARMPERPRRLISKPKVELKEIEKKIEELLKET